jgi:integrase/recombinase XerD
MVIVTRVRFRGPLEPYAQGFADELARQGYSPKTSMKSQLFFVSHLSRWLASQGRELSALACPEVVEAFLAERRRLGYFNHRTIKALRPLLGHLHQLGVLARAPQPELTPTEALLERYRNYLVGERGLVSTTARSYSDTVRPFVAGREIEDDIDLEGLTAAAVTEFVVKACAGRTRSSAKRTVTALRSLLGFLHVQGVLGESLVAAVPSAASWRLAGLPRGIKSDEVQRLLAAPDRRTRTGRRDFAVLMLLIRLGLRAGEVAALGLDDIDWRAGELIVRGKGDRHERLPLPHDVGAALVAYLQRGRPATAQTRSMFTRVCAPHGPMTPAAVSHAVLAAGRRAELGTVRAHRLRHTAASELLAAGASLTEIGQLLRHRSQLTTAIYAKVDTEALRALARPWPGGAA